MNTRPPPFDTPAHEREWQAQERAFERELAGLSPDENDPLAARYARLAHALRTVPQPSLPAEFASRVATLADASRTRMSTADRIDRAILIALCAGFVLAMAAAARIFWLEFADELASAASHIGQWPVALGLCLSISWMLSAAAPSRRPTM